MKVLWFTFSLCTAEPWHKSLPDADIRFYYDRWFNPPGLLGRPPDREMLVIAEQTKPDVILFCGMADADRMPSVDTFRKLRAYAPTVLLSGDLSDNPWWPFIEEFKRSECFDLIVNFDGNAEWPKRQHDLTLLTPIAHSFYMAQKPLKDRIIPFGWAGGTGSPSRAEIVFYLEATAGLQIMPRDETYGTYRRYANFLMECQLTLNVPHSGSDNSEQVKGRVLESALAGTCLLEHADSAAAKWFDAGIDYAVYTTKEDAAMAADYLLHHLDEAQAMALRLQKKVREQHSPEIFWDHVFKAVGL